MKKTTTTLLVFLIFYLNVFSSSAWLLHDWNRLLTELMVKDGFSPVLATRGFVYPNIAAYEALSHFDNSLVSLHGKLNGYPPYRFETDKNEMIAEAVMLEAIYLVSKEVMYREKDCDALYKKHIEILSQQYSPFRMQNSRMLGTIVANHVISWMAYDGYNETKAKPYYIFEKGAFNWQPTPPEYRNALEPHWKSLRTMVIKDAASYSVPLNTEPDSSKESAFYQLAMEVYHLSNAINSEQKIIAEFWDDNPDLNDQYKGHVGIPRRHISPASHWINIVRQVCEKYRFSLSKSVRIYTLLSIAEYDAKIVSWYDKYTLNLIRPVTYIRRYIDDKWTPHLVTPPFPEHTSGHSACSMACAEVLEALLGENFAFTDSTQLSYLGLAPRSFTSFRQAALEVSESRILGGIHFRPAVDAGMKQGSSVGKLVCEVFKCSVE